MSEKRFTTTIPKALTKVYDDGCILTNGEVVKYINWYRDEMRRLSVENAKLEVRNKHNLEDCSMEIAELRKENEQLKGELEEFKEVIIDRVQYGEDNLEEFLIKKGIISEDWARFDGYD